MDLKMQTLLLSVFVSVFVTLTHTDIVAHSFIHHLLAASLTKLSQCVLGDKL